MKRVEDTKQKTIRRTSQQMEKEQLATTTKAKHLSLKTTIFLVSIMERIKMCHISVGNGWMIICKSKL